MVEYSISNPKYTYMHDEKETSQAIDVHRIVVRHSGSKHLMVFFSTFLLLANVFFSMFLVKIIDILRCPRRNAEVSAFSLLWGFLLSLILVIKSLKSVDKESVVIFPDFGVQLENHYLSGKITRRFIPIGKTLKPVLNECVTPVTCYWSLSLIVHNEEVLMLVFKELRPPVKMLVPVWKALCAATSVIGTPDVTVDEQ